jgi:hypothetical protein
MSPIRREKVSSESKGKDPGSQSTVYKADLAIAWCRTHLLADDFIGRVWASGELISDPLGFGGTGTDEVAEIRQYTARKFNRNCNPAHIVDAEYIDYFFDRGIISDAFNDLIFRMVPGREVTISGAGLDPENVGTFVLVSRSVSAGPTPTPEDYVRLRVMKCKYEYQGGGPQSCDPVPGTTCPPGVDQTLTVDVTVSQSEIDDSPYYDSVECYRGSSAQAIDPTIEALEGSDIPAFRGTAYCVYKNFDVTKWAGTVPAFEAEVVESVDAPLSYILKNIVARTEGIPDDWVDTSQLEITDPVVQGFMSLGPSDPSALIEQLLLVYDVELQTISVLEGTPPSPRPTLSFRPRTNTEIIIVAAEDASARDVGTPGVPTPVLQYGSQDELPQELAIDYISTARDLQPATASYQLVKGAVRNQQKLTTSITMGRNFALRTAKKLLWAAVSRNNTAVVNLPPSYADLVPGDRIQLTLPNDEEILVRLTKVDRGAQGMHEIAGELDTVDLYEQFSNTIEDPFDEQTFPGQPSVTPWILDIPPLSRYQAYNFGVLVVVQSLDNEDTPFQGGNFFFSCDDKQTFERAAGYSAAANTGRTLDVLPVADPGFWDYTSTVTVELDGRTLDNASEESVACGANWAVIGGEIVGFTTATLIAENTYELSGFMRGLRDTAGAIDQHVVGERFVVVGPPRDAPGVIFEDLQFDAYNANWFLRAVPSGQLVEDQTPLSDAQVNATGESIRPFSVHSMWVNNTPDVVCIYATPQNRVPTRILGSLDVCDDPTFCEYEKFCCEVYRPNGGGTEWVYMRRLCGTRASNDEILFCYTNEAQVADSVANGFGGALTNNLRFVVYQYGGNFSSGSSNIKGRTTEFCIDSTGVTHDSADCEL